MPRIAVALLFLTLTAFAPAPFPRSPHRVPRGDITREQLQGLWAVTSLRTLRSNGMHERTPWRVTHIRIVADRWHFVAGEHNDPREDTKGGLVFALDVTKRPTYFHFVNPSEAKTTITGPGLIRRRADRIEIIYTWGNESLRSTSFETPTDGHWLLTLERVP